MSERLPPFLLAPRETSPGMDDPRRGGARSHLDRSVGEVARTWTAALAQWESSGRQGLLQGIDARVKLLSLAGYLLLASLVHDVLPHLLLAGGILLLAAASRLRLSSFYRRVLLPAAFFGLLLPLPAILNLAAPGELMLPLLRFREAPRFWIYSLPPEIGVTREGLSYLLRVFLRVGNSVSLSFLVLHTTPLPELLRGLKGLRVPDPLLATVHLAYKSVFLFLRTVEEAHLAKKSRVALGVSPGEARGWAGERLAFLFRKTGRRCEEVFLAMQSRGFCGSLVVRPPGTLSRRDLGAAASLLAFGFLLLGV